jgi:uncharacterized protein YbgA (DUF1722 family)/uncharacterized protein YbbK (DUF523 family)
VSDADPIRLGISSCLLGAEVRYDGGHKRDTFLVGTLGRFVEWVPICPEVEVGMGTPREPIRLVRAAEAIRLLGSRSGDDWTERMERFARARVEKLVPLGLSGYVLKKDSPSCGMTRVKVFPSAPGVSERTGTGLFAAALMARCPSLPVEEDGRLLDPRLRENFVERVFAYHRLQATFARRWTVGDLVRFHTAHKMQLLAHAPRGAQQLGRLVASAGATPVAEWPALLDEYEAGFMAALKRVASPGRHVNTLQHLAGFLKERLTPSETRELAALIEEYRAGALPLIAALTLLAHHLRALEHPWVEAQSYLAPYPRELGLRSAI